MKEIILLLHPIFGVLGILSAVWVFIEIINAHKDNENRIKVASVFVALSMVLTWIVGGYWYVTYYALDKAVILKGPWPFAHSIFMEVKEHLFFITLILSLLLPIVTFGNKLATNRQARLVAGMVVVLIVLSAMALEGAGGVISMGVKVGLLQAAGAAY